MRIIELSHPGVQFAISPRSKKKQGLAFAFDVGSASSGIRFWNNEKTHFRKFLKISGRYLENLENEAIRPEVQTGELLFWGEFEPPSRFTLLNNADTRLLPNAIHEPFFDEASAGLHHTDPYVFGPHFYYSKCKQHLRNMTALSAGSLILFGTEYAEGFALDTVLVVGKRIIAQEYLNSKDAFSYILRKATLENNNLYNAHTNLVLYQGKMFAGEVYQEDSPQTFSFFPCKPYQAASSQGFQRPLLNYQAFALQRPGAGTVLYDILPNPSAAEVLDYWQQVVAEVILQGFSLGIYADEPPVTSSASTLGNALPG